VENDACPAADASDAVPGCASGQPSPPSERELLSALAAAMQSLIDHTLALSQALDEQNAILMDLLQERTAEDDDVPLDLSGKPIR
jgi:hypothetical protein